MRTAPAPFPPALGQAAVGDPFEGLVGQVAMEIFRQGFRVGIAARWGSRATTTGNQGGEGRETFGLARRSRRAEASEASCLAPAEGLAEDQAQGVDVRACVDARGDLPSRSPHPPARRPAPATCTPTCLQSVQSTAPREGSGPARRWKSRSIGVPSAVSRTLEGFTSRWTSPRSWA